MTELRMRGGDRTFTDGATTGSNGSKPPTPKKDVRITALRRFAVAISVLNIAGYGFLGFEPMILVPLAALATAYTMELGLEYLDARLNGRRPKYSTGGVPGFIDFLLPAHITALAVGMLLYSGDNVWPVVFGVIVALASKTLLRVRTGKGTRHVLNPSNFGIAATLLTFTWVGIAPPYQFTENVSGAWDWVLPAIIVVTGSLLNFKLTGRGWLILGWLGGFVVQGLVRVILVDHSMTAVLAPVTGLAFVLFTFYMVTDPATTPTRPRNQVLFGLSVAALYGAMTAAHIAFGLFFALVAVCSVRGLYLYTLSKREDRA